MQRTRRGEDMHHCGPDCLCTLSGDLQVGLTGAQIAERHGETKDCIYGRMRRLGVASNHAAIWADVNI